MKLISCESCAVVLNLDELWGYKSQDYIYNKDGSFNDNHVIWDDCAYTIAIKCPVCKEKVSTKEKIL